MSNDLSAPMAYYTAVLNKQKESYTDFHLTVGYIIDMIVNGPDFGLDYFEENEIIVALAIRFEAKSTYPTLS